MARSGMAALITELRSYIEAGTADYNIVGSAGTTYYWSDDQMQDVLDVHRHDIVFEQLSMYPVQVAGGSLSYLDYRSGYGYYEQTTGGTSIFYIQDSTGLIAGTSAAGTYTPDYRRGQVQFATNTAGTVYYLTGRSYDLNAAAADIWRRKAAHVAPTSFDFSTDNHSISRSQVYSHALEMAKYFEGRSAGAIVSVPIFRSDVP